MSDFSKAGNRSAQEKKLRTEYTKLRDIAQKRIKRLGAAFPDSQLYRENKAGFKMTKEYNPGDIKGLKQGLIKLQAFTSKQTSTVSGMKQMRSKTISTLHERGITFVNESNLKEFGEFMDFNRALRQNGLYDSEQVAELYNWASKYDIDASLIKENFDYWMEAVMMAKNDVPDVPAEFKTSEEKLIATMYKMDDLYGKGTLDIKAAERKAAYEQRKQQTATTSLVKRGNRRK